jgi:hypothetical protein
MCLEGGNGAWGRDRTADTVIFSHVLYQLSYPGIAIFHRLARGFCQPLAAGGRAYG